MCLFVCGALAAELVACREAPPRPPPDPSKPVAAPATDPPLPCADVGGLRACWSDLAVAALVRRPVSPRAASSPMGWRCAGRGGARQCVDRHADAPVFSCSGDRCAQKHARRPDDGEWTCVDTAGAEVCLEGGRAAGVAAAASDPAWICGPRRGPVPRGGEPGARVCVDFSPDFPDDVMTAWRCHAVNGAAPARVCERGTTKGGLGAPCERSRPCVDGALCASGRCVPARPGPSCWLDGDCRGGACRFGSCRDEVTP
jgi:hypothetical protein